MKLFGKKAEVEKPIEEPKPIKVEDVSPQTNEKQDKQDKQLIIQNLMEDPEVKAYLAVVRGGEKFRIAVELEKEK